MKYLVFAFLFFTTLATRAIELPKTSKILVTEQVFTNAPFKECHASTLIESTDGTLLAAWFGGTRESNKDVEIWISEKRNGKWSSPQSVANGIINDSLRFACWNPVLFRTTDGLLSLYYKVGPNPREWWGMVIRSSDEGKSWSAPERLPDEILGPIKNKPITLSSGVILSPSSIETKTEEWHSHIERSIDGGQSWQKINIDPGNKVKVIQPTLLLYPGGKIQALLRSNQNVIMESWSADEGKSWSPLAKTGVLNPNSGIDGVTLKSGFQVLVYNPQKGGGDWVNGRNKLNIAASVDGKSWKDVAVLEDQESGEFSYPAIIQTSDGKIHVTYTYNRKSIKHIELTIE